MHYAYLRVSTTDQAESGAGLAAQFEACTRFAEAQGEEVTRTFKDRGVSGAKGLEDRPALLKAIGMLRRGDVLLVAKRDRLGRDPIHVAMIESAVIRKGARVVSAAGEGTEGDDPSNILMRRMIDAFAEYERLIIGARTRAAMQSMKQRKERVGSIPYGYTLAADGVHLKPNQTEQDVIIEARKLKSAGLSLRAISAELEGKGLLNRTGRAFAPEQVRRMLAA